MAICKYCGENAGMLRSVHKECETRHSMGMSAIDAFVRGLFTSKALPATVQPSIDDIARRHRLSTIDTSTAVMHSWSRMLDNYLEDGVLTREEEATLVTRAQQLGISRQRMESAGVLQKVGMGRALRDVVEGNIPAHQPQIPVNTSVNLQRGETVVWTFTNVPYHQETTRHEYVAGTSGVSVRVAKGVYYRVGGIRGRSVPITTMQQLDTGSLVITTKHVYFAGASTGFRIPYSKIVAFQPYSDGLGIVKDGARAKPQLFMVGSGWFAYNLVMNVSQWQ